MNGYEQYLEEMLALKEREIQAYKNFIETTLRCHIKEAEIKHESELFVGSLVTEAHYKVITIPKSEIVIRLK